MFAIEFTAVTRRRKEDLADSSLRLRASAVKGF